MNTNKKFVNMYLSFCKRLENFSGISKELTAEIDGMNELAKDPEATNFAKRARAKLRKFSAVLGDAVDKVEELSDSTQDLEKEVVTTDFAKAGRKVKILNKVFSDLEKDLKKINEDVKEVIEDSASEGEVTTHESAEPAQPGVVPTSEATVTQSEPVSPAQPGVVEGNSELNKKVAVNFSKSKYLFSKVQSICGSYKQFSEDLEGSGDLIEEITDEVTVDAEPTAPAAEAAASEAAPAEETPAPETDEFGDAAELADGIADDVVADDFNEPEAAAEVEKVAFAKKDAAKKLVAAFGKVKKHFDDKIKEIKKDLDATKTVDPKDLTSEEAKTLISEFKCFSDKNSKQFSKRLARKMANFAEVCEDCAEGNAKTEEVVDAAQDVVDVMDKVEDKPAEFQEFSEKVQKFIKMFSEDVTSENAEVTNAPSPEVLEKDGQLNSTLDTINGKIDTLDLNATVTNFAKISSKSLSAIKCFSMEDVNNKLVLVENFADAMKELCNMKNFEACPVCGKEPCECTPEVAQEGADAMGNLCKKFAETGFEGMSEADKKLFSTINSLCKKFAEEAEKPAEEKPAEEKPAEEKPTEETPSEEKPNEETPAPAEEKPAEETPAETPTEETPAEQPAEPPAEEKPAEETPSEETPAEEKPAEEVPSDEEVVLKNFSAKNNDYGKKMAHLFHMV